MLAKAAAGKGMLTITSIKTSAADFSGVNLEQLQELPQVKQEFPASMADIANDTTVKVTATINNKDLLEPYKIMAIGVYAKGSQGKEHLFAVSTANDPDTMEAIVNGVVRSIVTNIYIETANASTVKIAVNLDTYVTKGECFDITHPIGSIYMHIGGMDPASLFGGTWQKIEGRYLLASGTVSGKSYKAGDIGGSATHSITSAEMPPHVHDKGSYNITGVFNTEAGSGVFDGVTGHGKSEGAFYSVPTPKGHISSYVSPGNYDVHFDASRTWSGSSGSTGDGEPMPILPLFTCIDVWRRTA